MSIETLEILKSFAPKKIKRQGLNDMEEVKT